MNYRGRSLGQRGGETFITVITHCFGIPSSTTFEGVLLWKCYLGQ